MEYTEQQKQIYNDVCDKYKHNWLNTTISQTMAMEMISKALTIHSVVVPKGTLPTKEENNIELSKRIEQLKNKPNYTNKRTHNEGYAIGWQERDMWLREV